MDWWKIEQVNLYTFVVRGGKREREGFELLFQGDDNRAVVRSVIPNFGIGDIGVYLIHIWINRRRDHDPVEAGVLLLV